MSIPKVALWQVVLTSLVVVVALVWAIGVVFPRPVADLMMAGLRASAGLEEKTVEMPFGPVHYLEGGKGPTVVLLHGIYARKEHWIDFSRALTGHYRVVMPDLPGFGSNAVLGEGAYSYDTQAARLMMLMDALELDRFHLAGNSMGGQLGALYATRHPNRILSLAFIGSPAGVTSPVRSDMEKVLLRGEAPPLLVTTEEDFIVRFDWLFPETPYIPGPVLATWAMDEAAHAEDNRRIWREVGASRVPRLEALAPNLQMPTFILWCREDRVFHFTGAEALARLLPDDTYVPLSGCGHVPMLDKPQEGGSAYAVFLDGLSF